MLIRFSLWYSDYRMHMLATALFLAIGTLQFVPNYGTLNGELRVINEETYETGEYLGGV